MVIQSWQHLHQVLLTLTEEELRETINYEVCIYKRKTIIDRLHKRYTKVRAMRERPLLMNSETIL